VFGFGQVHLAIFRQIKTVAKFGERHLRPGVADASRYDISGEMRIWRVLRVEQVRADFGQLVRALAGTSRRAAWAGCAGLLAAGANGIHVIVLLA
jgi:hypothetical protein